MTLRDRSDTEGHQRVLRASHWLREADGLIAEAERKEVGTEVRRTLLLGAIAKSTRAIGELALNPAERA